MKTSIYEFIDKDVLSCLQNSSLVQFMMSYKSPSQQCKGSSQSKDLPKGSSQCKDLPIHLACLSGDKGAVKNIVSSLTRRVLEMKDTLGRTPLILTVTRNHVECGAVLLKSGVNVDNTDNAGQTALHIAASKGFHHFVKLLLTHKASWMQRDYFGATALHMAAIYPNVKGLSAIMKHVKSAEIDIQDSTLKTALHWCAAYACNDNMKILLAHGANSCIPDEQGKTPLHWAVANSNPEALNCVKTLLKKKVCLLNWQDYQGRSPLHTAVHCGSEEVLYFLASTVSCNTDLLDNSFCTPLHCAAKKGLSEKADILLKKRASNQSVDDNGATPLHYAVYNNHADTVQVFTSKSYINDNQTDMYGRNALIWGAIKGAKESVEALATCSDANLAFACRNGLTALHAAAIFGHAEIIEILVKFGISVDLKDNYGMTAFLKACEHGRSNAAQVLLNHGASMEEKDINGCSALHWCARGGSAYLSQILIRRGGENINCNIQDSYGMTPLHYASISGDFINCTCVLVESGANPNIEDFEGKTPLHAAVLRKRKGVVRYLCEHGADVNAMYLKDDWITPLDIAVKTKNKEIIQLLKTYGAVCINDIKALAAMAIQVWYRKKTKVQNSRKMPFSSMSSPFGDSTPAYDEVSNCLSLPTVPQNLNESARNSDLYHICNGCYHRIVCSHVCNKNFKNCYSVSNEEKAAITIQRAWKRFMQKTNLARIRSEVTAAFPNEDERLIAEELWKCRFDNFYKELNE